jgi:Uma2 family endonuclease
MSVESDYIGLKLASAMLRHVEPTKAGRVQGPDCGFQCFRDDPKRIRFPDATFIKASRVTAEVRKAGNCPIAPDVAAEVISPNDLAQELSVKVHQYLAAGVQLIWLVFPRTRAVWVLRANGTGAWLAGSESLGGEEVMPGFAISLDTLFAEE